MEETEKKQKSIFRQNALSKISSPEEFDHYLVVTRPGIWFSLAAIVILLIGVIVWGFLGRIETTYQIAVISMNGETFGFVPLDKADDVIKAGKITIGDKEYNIKDAGYSQDYITENDLSAISASGGNLSVGQPVKPLKIEASELTEGIFYTGETVIETVNPISYIIN